MAVPPPPRGRGLLTARRWWRLMAGGDGAD